MAVSRNMFTPFHLGLAMQIYRELNSETELCRFLTSVVNHEIEHTNGDPYISSGFRPIIQGGHLIQKGSDNIDIHAETVAGKNTFNSLARAVFQVKYVDEQAVCAEHIKRGRDC